MDISDALRPEQEELFYRLAPKMFGDAVLVSHAIVRQWDAEQPMTLSPAGLSRLRGRLPDTLLITDDMQMQGLQKALGTGAASLHRSRPAWTCSASATTCSIRSRRCRALPIISNGVCRTAP